MQTLEEKLKSYRSIDTILNRLKGNPHLFSKLKSTFTWQIIKFFYIRHMNDSNNKRAWYSMKYDVEKTRLHVLN